MTITDIQSADAITWARAVDQVNTTGITNTGAYDSGSSPYDVTVQELNGTTYVVTTWGDGDVTLHEYEQNALTGDYQMVLLGRYAGGSASDDGGYGGFGDAYTAPTITQEGDTLIIVAASENRPFHAWTYDVNTPVPTNATEAATTLDYRGDFLASQTFAAGADNQELQQFTLSNGETYYAGIDFDGRISSFQVDYNSGTDTLSFVDSQTHNNIAFAGDQPYAGNMLIRTDTLDQNSNNIIASGARETSFIQDGDTIFGYSVGTYGLQVTKWELDGSGELKGAQVVYADGTTTKDMAEAGYTSITSYPEFSPFDSTAPTLAAVGTSGGFGEINWLQTIAGVGIGADLPDGSLNVIDLEYLRGVGTFELENGQKYMAVSTWSGSENGVAVFTLDDATGLPTQMIGFSEGTIGASNHDADDFHAVDAADWSDVTVSRVGATDEYLLTFAGGDGLLQFQFDPTKSSLVNEEGAVSWIGYDKGTIAAGGSYGSDTDANGNPVAYDSGQTEFDLLPDGKVLTTDISGIWIGDPGLFAVCFAHGTLITTDQGEIAIEALQPGDLVATKDNGFKPIKWIGGQEYGFPKGIRNHKLRPIRIAAGALGEGLPHQDLYVSPQHRVLVKSKIAHRMCGFEEVLVPAKQLLDIEGIDVVDDCDLVTYYHFLFDQHEIVRANGAECESLFTGPEALKSVSREARAEILELFPELSDLDYNAMASRVIMSGRVSRQLAYRHLKNEKPLYMS